MMTELLLALSLLAVVAATATGAPGAYLVATWAARVVVAIADVPGLGFPTLVITAIVDGSLLWSYFQAAPELEHLGDRVRVREQAEDPAGVDECDGRAEPVPVLL